MSPFRDYPNIRRWASEYGRADVEDKRAAEEFVEIETREAVTSLRTELTMVSQGDFDVAIFDQVLGPGRAVRHGSYADWARLMLLWIATAKS
jgi:hypothetical protein